MNSLNSKSNEARKLNQDEIDNFFTSKRNIQFNIPISKIDSLIREIDLVIN